MGEYAGVRIWEVELMIDLGIGEAEYSTMPVKARARMIAARKLPGLIETLNVHREYQKVGPYNAKG